MDLNAKMFHVFQNSSIHLRKPGQDYLEGLSSSKKSLGNTLFVHAKCESYCVGKTIVRLYDLLSDFDQTDPTY